MMQTSSPSPTRPAAAAAVSNPMLNPDELVASGNIRLAMKLQEERLKVAKSENEDLQNELSSQRAIFEDTLYSMEAAHSGWTLRLKEVFQTTQRFEKITNESISALISLLRPFSVQILETVEWAMRKRIEQEALQYLLLRECAKDDGSTVALSSLPKSLGGGSGGAKPLLEVEHDDDDDDDDDDNNDPTLDAADRMMKAIAEYKKVKEATNSATAQSPSSTTTTTALQYSHSLLKKIGGGDEQHQQQHSPSQRKEEETIKAASAITTHSSDVAAGIPGNTNSNGLVFDTASKLFREEAKRLVIEAHNKKCDQFTDFANLFPLEELVALSGAGSDLPLNSSSSSGAIGSVVHTLLWQVLPSIFETLGQLRAVGQQISSDRSKAAQVFVSNAVSRPEFDLVDPQQNQTKRRKGTAEAENWVEAILSSAVSLSSTTTLGLRSRRMGKSIEVQTVLTRGNRVDGAHDLESGGTNDHHHDISSATASSSRLAAHDFLLERDVAELPPGSEPLLFSTDSFQRWNDGKSSTIPLTEEARHKPGPTPSGRSWVDLERENAELAKACQQLGDQLDQVKALYQHKLKYKDSKIKTLVEELTLIRHEYLVAMREGGRGRGGSPLRNLLSRLSPSKRRPLGARSGAANNSFPAGEGRRSRSAGENLAQGSPFRSPVSAQIAPPAAAELSPLGTSGMHHPARHLTSFDIDHPRRGRGQRTATPPARSRHQQQQNELNNHNNISIAPSDSASNVGGGEGVVVGQKGKTDQDNSNPQRWNIPSKVKSLPGSKYHTKGLFVSDLPESMNAGTYRAESLLIDGTPREVREACHARERSPRDRSNSPGGVGSNNDSLLGSDANNTQHHLSAKRRAEKRMLQEDFAGEASNVLTGADKEKIGLTFFSVEEERRKLTREKQLREEEEIQSLMKKAKSMKQQQQRKRNTSSPSPTTTRVASSPQQRQQQRTPSPSPKAEGGIRYPTVVSSPISISFPSPLLDDSSAGQVVGGVFTNISATGEEEQQWSYDQKNKKEQLMAQANLELQDQGRSMAPVGIPPTLPLDRDKKSKAASATARPISPRQAVASTTTPTRSRTKPSSAVQKRGTLFVSPNQRVKLQQQHQQKPAPPSILKTTTKRVEEGYSPRGRSGSTGSHVESPLRRGIDTPPPTAPVMTAAIPPPMDVASTSTTAVPSPSVVSSTRAKGGGEPLEAYHVELLPRKAAALLSEGAQPQQHHHHQLSRDGSRNSISQTANTGGGVGRAEQASSSPSFHLMKKMEDYHKDMLTMEDIARTTADGATKQRMLRQLADQHQVLSQTVVPVLHEQLRQEAERVRNSQSPRRQ